MRPKENINENLSDVTFHSKKPKSKQFKNDPRNSNSANDQHQCREEEHPTNGYSRFPCFLTQVLYTIQLMQNHNEEEKAKNPKCPCPQGDLTTVENISEFMRNKFGVNGDVNNRVKTVLVKASNDGFCKEEDGVYELITPVARLQKATSDSERYSIIQDLQEVFLYKPNASEEIPKSSITVSTSTAEILNIFTEQDIPALLRCIERMLVQQVKERFGEYLPFSGGSDSTHSMTVTKMQKSSNLNITKLPKSDYDEKRQGTKRPRDASTSKNSMEGCCKCRKYGRKEKSKLRASYTRPSHSYWLRSRKKTATI